MVESTARAGRPASGPRSSGSVHRHGARNSRSWTIGTRSLPQAAARTRVQIDPQTTRIGEPAENRWRTAAISSSSLTAPATIVAVLAVRPAAAHGGLLALARRSHGSERSPVHQARSTTDEFVKQLSQLTVPLLIMSCEHDPLNQPDWDTNFQKIVPGSRVHRFMHSAHEPQSEETEEFNRVLGGGIVQGIVGDDEAFALTLAIGIAVIYAGFLVAEGRRTNRTAAATL